MNIYEKLQKCRVELQSKNLKKSGVNNFSKFEYFELGDFLPIVNELFQKEGLCSVFSMDNEKATLTIIFPFIEICEPINGKKEVIPHHQEIVFSSPIAELELKGCNKIQALGGVHTYMKRYLYMNALEIVENDFFNGLTGSKKLTEVKSKTTSKPDNQSLDEKGNFITIQQKNELKAILGGVEFAKLMNSSSGKVTIEKYNEIIDYYNNKVNSDYDKLLLDDKKENK